MGIELVPLAPDDREQFILDNQEAFRYGALEEFGPRDDHFEEDGKIISHGKCGFTYARNFGIRYHDLPEDADDSFFLCKELIPGYLDGVTGVYQTPQRYYVEDSDVEEFDKGFPPKQKLKLPWQIF